MACSTRNHTAPGTPNIMGPNILVLLDTMELDGYVHLQDYTHSSIDVHIQDETTDDQDISF